MKPILYQSAETEFNTNGIGVLGDCVSCTVTEERNGIYELEMKYPVAGIHYADIALRSIITAKPNPTSDPQPFRVYEISKPMAGIVTVYAQHIAYDQAGIVVSPFTASSAAGAMSALSAHAVTDCPFTYWTDKSTVANMTVAVPSSIWSLLGGHEGSVLDVYGGEYEFDRYTVKLHNARGYDRGVTIRYGKNLTDLRQDESCAAVYTGVYPYWLSAEGDLVQLPEKIVNASGNYDFTRTLPLDLSSEWEEAPTEDQLRARAETYITANNIGVPKVSLTVSFVQLEQTEEYKGKALLERVSLCDTVHVEFPALGVSATAKCIKTVYNVLLERYDSVGLGDARTSLADIIVGQGQEISKKPSETVMRSAIMALTASILGASGGAVRLLDTNNDGMPDTLYIADNPDPALAVKVWRFNYEGWGASKTGYNGPFVMGATLNDGFVADFIKTGTLIANIIKAGILGDKAGKNYWDMETGEFSMSASAQVGGKTVDTIAVDAAKSAVSDYDKDLTQSVIFNRLTNNGEIQGIYMIDGRLYVNGTYMKTGIITDGKGKNYWDMETGELNIQGSGRFQSDDGATYITIEGNELVMYSSRDTDKPIDKIRIGFMTGSAPDGSGQVDYPYVQLGNDGSEGGRALIKKFWDGVFVGNGYAKDASGKFTAESNYAGIFINTNTGATYVVGDGTMKNIYTGDAIARFG